MKRVWRRTLGAVYLVPGLLWVLPLGGCLGYATRAVHQAVENVARHETMDVESLVSMTLESSGGGTVHGTLILQMKDGRRRSFSLSHDMQHDPDWEIPESLWNGTPFLFTVTDPYFRAGTPVQAVAADGSTRGDSSPLDPDQRAHSALVGLNKGQDERWFLFVYPAPAAPRDPEPWPTVTGPWMRFPIDPPVTGVSRMAQVGLGAVAYPVAFVVDVVTWPVQGVMYLAALGSIKVH